jgi:spermidine/putrescine transport system substrate-binding protein
MARHLSRRDLIIRGGALGATGLSLPALLAACGGSKGASTSVAPDSSSATTAGGAGDSITMFNWPLYIENDDASTSPTLKNFTAATGIKVDYRPEVDGNDTFTAKYEPFLSKGEGIGGDIVVLTSYMAARYVEKGYVQAFDDANFPNKVNLIDARRNPKWDPDNKHTVPYAIGQVGIAYFPDKVGGTITSLSDLLDPKLKNRVSILDALGDTVGSFMVDLGFNPEDGNVDQAKQAIAAIKKARDAGQFRKIVGNSYTDDLQTGEVWAALAWSGDIASLKKDVPGIEFVLPAKGALSFTDNLMIPVGAKNKAGAEKLINFLYDPKNSGPLFEAISYVSPVKGAADYMTDAGKDSIFINPPVGAKLYEFPPVTDAVYEELSALFLEATQL